jgi:putative addiction module killer protein
MIVERTRDFARWFRALKDSRARAVIAARIRRLADGNPDTQRSIGDGVRELKIDVGPGYRVYFVRTGGATLLLLAGGDKSTQDRDIFRAISMARELKG